MPQKIKGQWHWFLSFARQQNPISHQGVIQHEIDELYLPGIDSLCNCTILLRNPLYIRVDKVVLCIHSNISNRLQYSLMGTGVQENESRTKRYINVDNIFWACRTYFYYSRVASGDIIRNILNHGLSPWRTLHCQCEIEIISHEHRIYRNTVVESYEWFTLKVAFDIGTGSRKIIFIRDRKTEKLLCCLQRSILAIFHNNSWIVNQKLQTRF